MKIISTNIGQKRAIEWKGKTVYTGIFKYPVNETLNLGLHDVEKDEVIDIKYHGGIDKACYLYSADHYEYWKNVYPNIEWQWGMFGENLTIDGLNEAQIHIGDIFKMGTALVQVTQPRQPCFKLGFRMENATAVKFFVNAEKPGAYIRILKEGMVNKGDLMELVEKKPANLTLKEVFHLIYHAQANINKVKLAITMTELAESCRNDLKKYAKL